TKQWTAGPIIAGCPEYQATRAVTAPHNSELIIGRVHDASLEDMEKALSQAEAAFPAWSHTPVNDRAACLNRFADLLQANMAEFLRLACLEAGKTWNDGVAEVREAIDFCRYYASMAKELMGKPTSLHGYTGELNELSLHPRGTVLCISPWNF